MSTSLPSTASHKKPDLASTLAQLVTFELFSEIFALPILDVREVIHLPDITPVPQAPSFVEGVINLRGQIIPIVDLRRRFGLMPGARDENNRIIVVGLTGDAGRGAERLPRDSTLPPPSLIAGSIGAEYIKGISNHEDKMIIHIDLRKVFSTEELSVLESAAA